MGTREVKTTAVRAVPLAEAARWRRGLVGAKAANLGMLVAAGFPVPEGWVLTTTALAGSDADLDATVDEIDAAMPDAVFAVRSSAVAEDRADASLAGRYLSTLGVRGPHALRGAVRACRRSAGEPRLGEHGGARTPMAVIVQRQVDADAAGIAFTADPITGERDSVMISAVPGLGDVVAGGSADPDEWTVHGEQALLVRGRNRALTAQQVRQLAALARRIEAITGCPQDVEWALASGRPVVLQARPITALPVPPRDTLPPGRTWVKDSARYAEPFSALGASLAPAMVAAGLTRAFTEAGALVSRVDARMIAGEMYTSVITPGRPASAPPPWWMLGVLSRINPDLRARCARAVHAVDPAHAQAATDRWQKVQGVHLDAAAARLRAVEVTTLDDDALADHLDDVRDALEQAMRVHFALTVAVTVPIHRLVGVCRALLGWSQNRSLMLLAGSSPASSEPGDALRALAARVPDAERLAVRETPPGALWDRFAQIAPSYAAAFAPWCERFAFRGLTDDPGSPVLWEQPLLLERLIRAAAAERPGTAGMPAGAAGHVGAEAGHAGAAGNAGAEAGHAGAAGHASAAADGALADARAALAGAPAADRELFETTLRHARAAHGVRDDVAVRTGATFGGLLRRAALEAGARLVARDALGRREDAAQLDFATLQAALRRQRDDDLAARVARALGERAWVRAHPGPQRVGPVAPPPDLRGLPRAARELNAALLWMRDDDVVAAASPIDPAAAMPLLHGAPASPGTATGPARVVLSAPDLARVEIGDVLVCRTADPTFAAVFAIACAVVTDHGGALSHAAIGARENGIPAVLGTGNATTSLHDGQIVTVDGTTGRVDAAPEEGNRS
ncbi:hypothetical protein ET475_10945 [Microbacterium protaetiae]|uniref:Phosphoenolpyruvate synthase n=1 Tax=Microbacterium protaetiae TaxID=2509458 RepID=A0A4P6EG96_9MICO|nr:PEP/pyruvate-binding domain-containing protein [Microbacterium protaetiae]QAY60453.1 hypothetical protein ET475_10945 [Microbacterium protaetiae]